MGTEGIEYTRELVEAKARAVFPPEAADAVLSILDEYGTEGERERVQLAILKLSGGEIARLRDLVELAKRDFRDVLMPAEYPEADRRGPFHVKDADKADVLRRDREQWLAWLRGS